MPASASGTWDQLFQVTQAKLTGAPGADRKKVALALLEPNPAQPRQLFEPAALAELAASIGTHGILQPLLVRPHPQAPGRYQIVAGERRYQAAKQLGLAELPVVLRELSDGEALELALVENLLREDITPLEEARSLQRLLDTFGYSYAQLGERLGKNKAFVDHRVRLLKMPADLQDALDRAVVDPESGKLRRPFSPRHAGVVVQLEDAAARAALTEAVFSQGLSVAEAGRRKRQLLEIGALSEPALVAAVVAGLSDQEFSARRAPAMAAPAIYAAFGEATLTGGEDTAEWTVETAEHSFSAGQDLTGGPAAEAEETKRLAAAPMAAPERRVAPSPEAGAHIALAQLALARFFPEVGEGTAELSALWEALEADRKFLRQLRAASDAD